MVQTKKTKTIKLKNTLKNTLKNKIHQYINKKGNICCEENINREKSINDLFELYVKIATHFNEKENYLDYVSNDLVVFIGYLYKLKENKNTIGVNLWESIDKLTQTKKTNDKTTDKNKLIKVLKKVPLYYLLSFLGYAYYRTREIEDTKIIKLNK